MQEQSIDQEFDETMPIGAPDLNNPFYEVVGSDLSFLTENGFDRPSAISSAEKIKTVRS